MIRITDQTIYANASGTKRLELGELRNSQRVYADVDGDGALQPFDVVGNGVKYLRPLVDAGEVWARRTRQVDSIRHGVLGSTRNRWADA